MNTIPKRVKIWSWYNIGDHFGVTSTTVQRWCKNEPEFRRLIRRWRRKVFAYEDDLETYRNFMERKYDSSISDSHGN